MLAVRWLHVVAMAVVLGGATLTWWQFRRTETTASAATAALDAAAAYERGFWAAMGVIVMTGVGNLGSLAPFVPESGTPWGTAFAVKLLLVVALLALSVVRTLLVVQYRRAETHSGSDFGSNSDANADPDSGANADSPANSDFDWPVGTLRVVYATTALSVAALVVFAEVMAHG